MCPNQCLTLHCPALGGWVFQTAAPELLFPWGCGWLLAMGHRNRALKETEETEVFFLSRLPHYSLHVLLFSQDLLLWVVSFHCHSIVVTASQILWLAKLNSFIIFFIIFFLVPKCFFLFFPFKVTKWQSKAYQVEVALKSFPCIEIGQGKPVWGICSWKSAKTLGAGLW